MSEKVNTSKQIQKLLVPFQRLLIKLKMQNKNKFPPYLKYIEATYDEATSFSAIAFRDTRTGKVTVGFAGTNGDNGGQRQTTMVQPCLKLKNWRL